MAKYQKYAEYKDSGVEWLGEMPAKWKVLRYKNILKIMQGMAFKSSEYVDSSSVINIRMGNIKKGGSIDLNHNTKYLPENYKSIYGDYELRQGDTIIAMTDMSPTLDFLAVPAILDCLDANSTYLLNQRVGKLILNRDYEIRFVRYLLLSENLRIQLKAKGLGTVQANMSNDDLYSSYLFCPPSVERLNIANFLDHETTKIDHLIEKQQQLIELLKEKRQAVISHAVTKGLNPDVAMKDSGVEWLGEVPEHWEVSKFGYISQVVRGGSPRPAGDPTLFNGDYSPWVTVAEITKDDELYLTSTETFLTKKGSEQCRVFKAGTLLLSNSGATLGVPKILCIDANANDGVVGFEQLQIDIEFAYYYLSILTNDLRERVKQGSGQPNLNTDIVKNISIAIPPLSEIQLIVTEIKGQVEKFVSLIQKAERQILLMQERRTALISAAVTGKIDVRNWQSPTVAETHTELSA